MINFFIITQNKAGGIQFDSLTILQTLTEESFKKSPLWLKIYLINF